MLMLLSCGQSSMGEAFYWKPCVFPARIWQALLVWSWLIRCCPLPVSQALTVLHLSRRIKAKFLFKATEKGKLLTSKAQTELKESRAVWQAFSGWPCIWVCCKLSQTHLLYLVDVSCQRRCSIRQEWSHVMTQNLVVAFTHHWAMFSHLAPHFRLV